MLGKQLQTAAAGNAGEGVYVEDVFSTYLYNGNDSTNTITNGIDLAGEGGLVWLKARDNTYSHWWMDTARGFTNGLKSESTAAQANLSSSVGSVSSTGFSLTGRSQLNASPYLYASWTFRKAEKFFDVVTYTGTGSARTVAHNLGSAPGCIIVKRTDTISNWAVYHISNGATYWQALNTIDGKMAESGTFWNNTSPTSSVFSLGTDSTVNASGGTYVAYLFAHDAGGFGDNGTESVIKCGAMTSYARTVDLGWEPQWVLVKSTASSAWFIIDSMRGWTNGGNDPVLQPHLANAEYAGGNYGYLTPTGFVLENYYNSDPDVIYMAIRRGPMKTPEDATEVFTVSTPGTGVYTTTTNYPIDSAIVKSKSTAADWYMMSRLAGDSKWLNTNASSAESSIAGSFDIDSNTSFTQNLVVTNPLNYIFRRAPGFFDVVAYTGTGSARTVNHNLGVTPELIIVKVRNLATIWCIYSATVGNAAHLRFTNAGTVADTTAWNSTSPTSTDFTVGTASYTNGAYNYVAYLFASCPGVSKVGSYTGTGTTLNVDCGFSTGARFILIKRVDAAGDNWYVWDTARGIGTGNDPYLYLDVGFAEVTNTDYIDPLSSGFQISSSAPAAINANGGSYIFLAIA